MAKWIDGDGELGRLVLLPCARFNAETWFLARCFDLLRADGVRGVVSFSDPVPRRTASGDVIFAGHLGTIYKAHNGVYLGRGTRRTLRLLPDGQVFSDRAASKIRCLERGWEYCVRQLVAAGADDPTPEDLGEPRAWLRRALERVTRPLVHSGNHKYAWALDRRSRRVLPASAAYPRELDAGAPS